MELLEAFEGPGRCRVCQGWLIKDPEGILLKVLEVLVGLKKLVVFVGISIEH